MEDDGGGLRADRGDGHDGGDDGGAQLGQAIIA